MGKSANPSQRDDQQHREANDGIDECFIKFMNPFVLFLGLNRFIRLRHGRQLMPQDPTEPRRTSDVNRECRTELSNRRWLA
jgi:hypothetical protein